MAADDCSWILCDYRATQSIDLYGLAYMDVAMYVIQFLSRFKLFFQMMSHMDPGLGACSQLSHRFAYYRDRTAKQ